MKPHKHAELIKAWADGQVEVEYRYPKDDGSWSLWKDLIQCVFHDWYEYRIKSEITQFNTQLHPVKELTEQSEKDIRHAVSCYFDDSTIYGYELSNRIIAILRKAQEK